MLRTIYNNKLTGIDAFLIYRLGELLNRYSIGIIGNPLIVLCDEEMPEKKEQPERGKYDYDNLLGYYVASELRIVLQRSNIHRVSQELEVPEEELRAVVLLHELGHYYSHLCPLWTMNLYPTVLFDRSDTSVLEAWAQLFALWAVQDTGCEYIFDKLLQDQSWPYKVFERYDSSRGGQWTHLDLLHSLDGLRALDHPATLTDWNAILQAQKY